MDSPSQTIANVLNEPSNGFDDLRIIAKDRGGKDRAIIEAVADELESAQRTISVLHASLAEARMALTAANDRLLEMYKLRIAPGVTMTLQGDLRR